MADFSNPKNANPLLSFLGYIRDCFTSVAKMFDGTTDSNVPVGAKKIDGSTKVVSQWNGSSWDAIGSVAVITAVNADSVTVSNLETDNFKSGVIVTTVGATGTDVAIPTEQAVREAVSAAVSAALAAKSNHAVYYVGSESGNGSGSDASNYMSWDNFAAIANSKSTPNNLEIFFESNKQFNNGGTDLLCYYKNITFSTGASVVNLGNCTLSFFYCNIVFEGFGSINTYGIIRSFGSNLFFTLPVACAQLQMFRQSHCTANSSFNGSTHIVEQSKFYCGGTLTGSLRLISEFSRMYANELAGNTDVRNSSSLGYRFTTSGIIVVDASSTSADYQ